MSNYKFYVGYEGAWDAEKVDWVKEHFPKEAYTLVDDGWFVAEYWIYFNEEKDALLYRLRWLWHTKLKWNKN